MAFWSKSDDPWDRKPEKGETRWREQDVPAPQEAEQQEPTAEQQRIRRIIEGPAPAPESAENCPWCGGQMKQVSIYTDKGFLRWRFGEPGGLFDSDYEVLEEARDIFDPSYKRGWYCEKCEKMVLDVKKPRAQTDDPNSFTDYVRQWREMEEREKAEQRKKQEN